MLPELDGQGYKKGINKSSSIYYVIDSEWKELDENFNLTNPKSPNVQY